MAHIFTSCCMPMGPQSPQAKLSLVGPYRAQQHAKHAHGWDADHKENAAIPAGAPLLTSGGCLQFSLCTSHQLSSSLSPDMAAAAAQPVAPGPVVREGDTVIWDVNGDKQALVVVDGKR